MSREAAALAAVEVVGTAASVINASKMGASTTISDSALTRLPTLNRNFSDFVQLVPQVSTTTGYLSGGGVNLRQNSIQIDGAQSGDLFGIGTTGQPGASANAKSIPLDAVKEYQVLLSPFDVRQGSFGGLLINAITKSGTNEFHGGLFAYTRNQKLTRTQPYLADYKQTQYGGSLRRPDPQGPRVLLRERRVPAAAAAGDGPVHRRRATRSSRRARSTSSTRSSRASTASTRAAPVSRCSATTRTRTSSAASTPTCR